MKRLAILMMSVVLAVPAVAQSPSLGMAVKEVTKPSADGSSTQEYCLQITLLNRGNAPVEDFIVRWVVGYKFSQGSGRKGNDIPVERIDPRGSKTIESGIVKVNRSFAGRRNSVPGIATSVNGYGVQALINGKIASEFCVSPISKTDMESFFENMQAHRGKMRQSSSNRKAQAEKKLEQLKTLLEKGDISKEFYERKAKEIDAAH